jgi:hypothetical protein
MAGSGSLELQVLLMEAATMFYTAAVFLGFMVGYMLCAILTITQRGNHLLGVKWPQQPRQGR